MASGNNPVNRSDTLLYSAFSAPRTLLNTAAGEVAKHLFFEAMSFFHSGLSGLSPAPFAHRGRAPGPAAGPDPFGVVQGGPGQPGPGQECPDCARHQAWNISTDHMSSE